MKNSNFEELTISLGTIMTFISYLISSITIDLIKDLITVVVGVATATYTVLKIIAEIKKAKYYKSINKQNKIKDNESRNRTL